MADSSVRIDIRQLRPGLYISLGERWLDHDFLFNSFRISNQGQIDRLRALGLSHIDYFPGRSTSEPLPLAEDVDRASGQEAPGPEAPTPGQARDLAEVAAAEDQNSSLTPISNSSLTPISMSQELEERRRRMAQRRAELARCEKAYRRSVDAVRKLMADVFLEPRQAHEQASTLIDDIVGDLLSTQHAVVNLMSDSAQDAGVRYHALNVTILSLLLGRAAGLNAPAMLHLGLGALMHDLGKVMVPGPVLRLDAPQRNRHQDAAYRLHVDHGATLCAQLGIETPEVIDIVRHHHERLDGLGFPDRLSGDQITQLVRIVSIANRFDGLCHTIDPARALTPAEALATMYRRESAAFDVPLLQRFIKCLGVWPPGTLVQLSNGAVGLVTAVSPDDTLRPMVMVGDPSVPRQEALMVDLREAPDVKIERALKPAELEPSVLAYLSPRMGTQMFLGKDVSAG